MTPYYQDNFITLYCGDAREVLPQLEENTFQCVVTSPPYFGLRDYGTATWMGGVQDCDHQDDALKTRVNRFKHNKTEKLDSKNPSDKRICKEICSKCGAKRVDNQIGLESSPMEFIEQMRDVFAKVRRVMREDGTLFLNLGDSYANDAKWGGNSAGKNYTSSLGRIPRGRQKTGFKPKDLMMLPHRVAIALQCDGFWVRQDIVWAKPNPMPESVSDRCTKAHEYIFHMSKSEKYFFDNYAIREPYAEKTKTAWGSSYKTEKSYGDGSGLIASENWANTVDIRKPHQSGKANKRSVWNVSTKAFPEAHFATFPPEIPQICIKAATSAEGKCRSCGAPFKRIVEPSPEYATHLGKSVNDHKDDLAVGHRISKKVVAEYRAKDWAQQCNCSSASAEPCVVLDPFAGAGTTLIEAKKLGRKAVGIELNPEYCEMIVRRIRAIDMPLFE